MSAQGITPRRGNASRTSRTRQSSQAQNRRSSASRRSQAPKKIPPKRIALVVGALVLALLVFGFIGDIVTNFGKIHAGVTMQGVKVGGLTREEAAELIESELGALVNSAPVDLFANEQAASEGADDDIIEITSSSTSYSTSDETTAGDSWRITANTVGVTIDGAALAEEAYAIGRGFDFFAGRLTATFSGVALKASLGYDSPQLAALETLLSEAIGWPMVNADINFDEGSFIVTESSEGSFVDHGAFTSALDGAFLGTDQNIIVPMTAIPVDITEEEAQQVADLVESAVSQPVALIYSNEDSWNLDSWTLGSWISTFVEGAGAEARLVPTVAKEKLENGIHDIIGDRDPGIKAQNARFEEVDGQIRIVPSVNGTGLDYTRVTADLNGIVFPQGDSVLDRRVVLSVTALEPELTTQAAEEMHITDKIASYTTEYTIASSAKVTNIHLAADLLNNSMIEPGGIWSFNDTAGECNAERGFQEAKSIVEGEYVDEIGGGICQVATTVFNTVFESGLPIVERVNHGFYLIAYPAGRDATVSWKWPDLKFENDTGHWLLLTLSYTDSTLTCTLWGSDPGYVVQSDDTGFTDRTDFEKKEIENPDLLVGEEQIKQEGVRGRTIVVTRYVYNSSGELLRKTDFKSVYDPETEIKEIGTKEPPKADETAGTAAS